MDYKFNVGDIVRIKDADACEKIDVFTGNFTSSMHSYCGKTDTIRRRYEVAGRPAYSLENYPYTWDERALEPVTVFEMTTQGILKITDKPKLKYNIKKVIFNNPATIVLWNDDTKTVVKAQGDDVYDKEKGFALCIAKKCLGNKGNFNNEFKKWLGDE